ncbi:saccharopine dehydrogenase NADP-binding domain-containing protein [Pseudomonas sp. TH41]|nr:saccharopine dehydrogenase NADP-binding domain-containing protein [Pseudomonas sp. TH41]
MIYGATGYTGLRLARMAKKRGLLPVLAGRNAVALELLGAELGLPWRAFNLDDTAASQAALSDMNVVAHCAGPYSATSKPMLDTCLAVGCHYADLTGEVDVILAAQAHDAAAKHAGITVITGAGFDVIPTDCIAAVLKQALPDATHLTLGFSGLDDLSPGTLKSSLESVGKGMSKVRVQSALVDIPYFSRNKVLNFADGKGSVNAFNIPWADVATAYFSTGIPNIEVYVPRSSAMARSMSLLKPFVRLLRNQSLVSALKRLVDLVVKGPGTAAYENGTCHVIGEVHNARGDVRRAHLRTPNGYCLTVDGMLMTVSHLLAHPESNGFHTPTTLMGSRCVERLSGVSTITLS